MTPRARSELQCKPVNNINIYKYKKNVFKIGSRRIREISTNTLKMDTHTKYEIEETD